MGSSRREPTGTHLHLVLMKAHRVLARHATESMAAMGLGFSDFTVLEALLHKGPQLVNDIGRRIQLTSGAITTAVDRLEARGLVAREQDERDARARIVSLTRAGRELIEKAFAAHQERMDATADALTKAERATLLELLKKLGYGAAAMLEERGAAADGEEPMKPRDGAQRAGGRKADAPRTGARKASRRSG